MKKIFALLAALCFGAPALGQNGPAGSVPSYKGTTISGFNSSAPGTSGFVLTSNGAGLQPTFKFSAASAAAGSPGQCQYNNAGAFGGITNCTSNGTTITLVAPVLGTPASVNLTNATALPVGAITGLGTGVAMGLATNINTASGFVGFSGALGTPTSGILTNATGLPISTGLAGAGTGILASLGVNIGSAGAPVLFNGAGGTPSSIVLTNGTGLPLSGHTTQAAYTFVGNNTGGAAVPTAVDIAALTTKASPAAGDFVILSDQAASGAWKKALISSIASAGSVSSIAGNTGAFTLNTTTGLLNVANDIQLNQGSAAQFGAVKVDNTSISASAGIVTSIAATKAQQVAASDNNVNVKPAHQQEHPSAVKAWARCTNSAGTYTLAGSYNISGGTCGKTGTGRLTLTLTTAFTSTAFSCVVSLDSFLASFAFPASASTITVGIATFAGVDTNEGFSLQCTGTQ